MTTDPTPTVWRRSRRCDSGNCVEVAAVGDVIAIRVSNNTTGPELRFTRGEFAAFLAGVKDGDFDDLAAGL